MKLVPFEPGHIRSLVPQQMQAADLLCMDEVVNSDRINHCGPAVTGMIGDEVIFCIGKSTQWAGRHIVWALMSVNSGKHMVSIVKNIKRLMALHKGDGRFELIVRSDFPQGCRLAEKVMGFKFHHFEEKFLPDGADANIYVRYL